MAKANKWCTFVCMAGRLCICRTTFVATLLVGVACTGEPAGPATCADYEGLSDAPQIPLVHETEHLDIHVADGRFLCAGSALEYERFYSEVGDILELELDARVPLYLPNNLSEYCPDGAPGCRSLDGLVYVSPGTVRHELAHAATCEWRSRSAHAITEGVAVAFEPTPLAALADPDSFVTDDRDDPVDYDKAGHFARWLLEEYGPQAMRTLYRAAPLEGGDGVLSAVSEAFGAPYESIAATYLSDAPAMWIPFRQCDDLATLEPIEGTWSIHTELDCDSPMTSGPWERDGYGALAFNVGHSMMYRSYALEIPDTATYQFQRQDWETGIWLERCIDESGLSASEAESLWMSGITLSDLHGSTEIELTPGTYRLDVLRPRGPAQTVAVEISALPVEP